MLREHLELLKTIKQLGSVEFKNDINGSGFQIVVYPSHFPGYNIEKKRFATCRAFLEFLENENLIDQGK